MMCESDGGQGGEYDDASDYDSEAGDYESDFDSEFGETDSEDGQNDSNLDIDESSISEESDNEITYEYSAGKENEEGISETDPNIEIGIKSTEFEFEERYDDTDAEVDPLGAGFSWEYNEKAEAVSNSSKKSDSNPYDFGSRNEYCEEDEEDEKKKNKTSSLPDKDEL
jgi:hypothetical protein